MVFVIPTLTINYHSHVKKYHFKHPEDNCSTVIIPLCGKVNSNRNIVTLESKTSDLDVSELSS